MVAKLVTHPEGYALILNEDLVARLHLDINAPLDISVQANSLVVSQSPALDNAAIDKIAGELEDQYDPVFKKLAE